MTPDVPQMSDPRQAGAVVRYHTWTTLQRQTNAEHQWNVARILLAIWPECPREVLMHGLFHDSGELHTGDLPFPVKKNNPDLKEVTARVEAKGYDMMVARFQLPSRQVLDEVAHRIFKLAEHIEMWEFALTETEMGNRHGMAIVERVFEPMCALVRGLPDTVQKRASAYIQIRTTHHDKIMGDRS
jgi:5'-deoxynucleotidase YfbR-like HD superfamily hydrolase